MDDQQLTKLTVNLTPKSSMAIAAAANLSGHTRTDTVNRAVQLYAAVIQTMETGGGKLNIGDFPGRLVELNVTVTES